MSEAMRFNEGKPKLSYFTRSFRWMTAAVARVMEFGGNKYNEGNWRLGNKPDEEYLDSCFRHLDHFFAGEFYDQDSACSHIAHAVWNLSAMMELNYPDHPVIDEELFRERMAHWLAKKEEREGAGSVCIGGEKLAGLAKDWGIEVWAADGPQDEVPQIATPVKDTPRSDSFAEFAKRYASPLPPPTSEKGPRLQDLEPTGEIG